MEQGSFFLPCLYERESLGLPWGLECKRAWVVDSYYGKDWSGPREDAPSLGFFGYTEQEFDDQDWEDCIIVVRPDKWANQYKAWLRARPALLRDDGRGMTRPAR